MKTLFNSIEIAKKETGMSLKRWMSPFFLALGGVVSDYVSTTIGLRMGFYETNLQYNPVWALLVYWGALMILYFTCCKKKLWKLTANALALISYLGVINNTLVISGAFPGIKI